MSPRVAPEFCLWVISWLQVREGKPKQNTEFSESEETEMGGDRGRGGWNLEDSVLENRELF